MGEKTRNCGGRTAGRHNYSRIVDDRFCPCKGFVRLRFCFSIPLQNVLRYAEKNGITVVVAAGNESMDLDHDGNYYSTYCGAPHVICVSATGATNSGWRLGEPFTDIDSPARHQRRGSGREL